MTYQQVYEILQDRFTKKSAIYVPLEKKISETKGFSDIEDMPTYRKVEFEYRKAKNQYFDFIEWAKKNNINPNDEADLNKIYS